MMIKYLKIADMNFVSKNIDSYNNNSIVIEGVKNLIKSIPKESTHQRYIELIEGIIKKMDEENPILYKLLVTTPYKYKELITFVGTILKISILPENAETFYSISKMDENRKSFDNFFEKEKGDTLELKNQIKNLVENVKSLQDSLQRQRND